jgi:peptide deformylase
MVEEGCLSVPGFIGTVERSIWVKFRALNLESKTVRIKAESLLAQVLEHEVDHLNGILYMDHLSEHEKLRPITEEEYSSTIRPTRKLDQADDLNLFHSHSESEINPS